MKGKKTGGRQKGSLNKSNQEIKEIIDRIVDFDLVVSKLYGMTQRSTPDPTAAKILFEYRYGKAQQTIDTSVKGETTIKIVRS